MADTLKVLGQADLTTTSLTDIYTVPGSTQAVVSSIIVANRSATPTTFRISVAVAAAADATKQYLYYDVPIAGNDTFVGTLGLGLGAGDVVRAKAGAANQLSINVMGVETV